MADTDAEVAIVGAGAVGLFLGCRLAQLGIEPIVFERRLESARHSRSISIHPPLIDRMQRLGVAGALVRAGVVLRRGVAFGRRGRLGEIDLGEGAGGACPFALSLPQHVTEAILERRLAELAPGALHRGTAAVRIADRGDRVEVAASGASGAIRVTARVAAGCDGVRSSVRRAAGIAFPGGGYRREYLLGDFRDDTRLGEIAAVFLTAAGPVESFPLPHAHRRWVVEVDAGWEAGQDFVLRTAPPERVAALVAERIGHRPTPASCRMSGGFRAEHYLARTFARGLVALAGDAAHVLSPIGGQGMNLGWLDAWALADAIAAGGLADGELCRALARYAHRRRRAARRATRRAERNMQLGAGGRLAPLRDRAVASALAWPPARRTLTRAFTMGGLG